MDKLKAVIKREYLTRVRSKGFIIGTILSPLIMSSFILVPVFLGRSAGPDKYQIVALDQSGDAHLFESLTLALAPSKPGQPRYELSREEISSQEELEARRQVLSKRVADKQLDGYLILPRDALRQEEIKFYAKNAGGFSNQRRLEGALQNAISERRIALEGLDAGRIRDLTRGVELTVVNERGESERGRVLLALALVMLIYITVLIYGVTVMRGVMEEKQSRIIEVLLASVNPFDLMLGKVIGIGLVGLTQYVIWAVSAMSLSALSAGAAIAGAAFDMPKVSVSLMIFFMSYYLLGYFLYAALYAMIGAVVSNEDDGQQAQWPVSMTFAVSMVVSTLAMENPNGVAVTVLSLIPFFGPSLMFLRIALGAAPAWQIAVSIILLVASIIALTWVAAKIYRVGVLMYGKRPTIPELAKWLKYS
ncbi:MAG TPA: ABC transporter permease [Blastocatellia bacterium]|jgi:ABC-2 type transport system permease protein|nr:ABC transporter permease [Blastocatellia bacterium]